MATHHDLSQTLKWKFCELSTTNSILGNWKTNTRGTPSPTITGQKNFHTTPNTYQNKKAITLVCKSLPFNLLKETYKYLSDNTYSPEQMSFILPHANYRIAQFVKKIPTLLNNQFGKCSSLRHQIYNCINSRNLHFLLYSEPYPMPGSQRLQLNWCDIIHIRSLPPTTVQQIHIFCSIHHTQLANMI